MGSEGSSGRAAAAEGVPAEDAVELTLALCHEVRNLLAAVRLSAYLIARETDSAQVRASIEDIEAISVEAGAALAHIRPLLDAAGESPRVDPVAVLEAVGRSLTEIPGRAAPVEVRWPDALPDVRVDPDALHHLLVTLALSARETVREPGAVRVGAEAREGSVVFRVEDDGDPLVEAEARPKPDPVHRPGRRGLGLRVAEALMRSAGGGLRIDTRADGTRVELVLPVLED